MRLHPILFATVLGLAAAREPVALASEAGATPAPCVLEPYTIVFVWPHYEEELRRVDASVRRMRGAELYVQAEFGLTAEWLRLQIARHRAAMKGRARTPNCPLDVDSIHVTVESRGVGFLVTISTKDAARAQEILRRAKILLD